MTEDVPAATEACSMDIAGILAALPHRYPMLLVDRVAELVQDERIRAIKAVSFNESFFQGHFPGRPIMPGVLQIEALAQAAGILAVETMNLAGSGKLVYFMAIDEAKFRAPVEPGCLLSLEVSFVQKRARVCKFRGVASVDGKVTCEVSFTAMIADAPA
ncbi:3-hydroxyacyl-ACP dehydratase [Croceibacterium mercuriale]|uniref:3-hydroxyacyl-[acyl-carrier-protein] dehydratase FabZ n=1 Tax=Croceibacterium mercuriale TaxID=1572751 RepID=A0A0B2C2A6_9SPHN|nr:3-hydroxyacyl-ACP dehydratase FabZ [Croceibacterium mercuriale]KHL26146.1 3-hydroxyacyl-ACP dehydratase [Croceibacterium mercuriale]